jgi:hypothetical protein
VIYFIQLKAKEVEEEEEEEELNFNKTISKPYYSQAIRKNFK